MLLIENWAYLGSARSEEEIWQLLDGHAAQFDKDTHYCPVDFKGGSIG